MPPERTPRRQDPASCESCRKKKLRCDRKSPCNNCKTRSISCIFLGGRPQADDGARYEATGNHHAAESAAIKARLCRLEDAVFRTAHVAPFEASHSLTSGLPTADQVGVGSPRKVQDYNEDSRRLEDVHSRGGVPLPQVAKSLLPRIVNLSTLTASITSAVPPAELLLPQREETNQFVVCYVEHPDALQHIIHVPSVRRRFDFLYDVLENRRSDTVSGGLLALLLAVLAQTAGFWALGNLENSFFASRQEALAVSTYWLRCALDATEHVWRVEGSDLEVVQAKILLIVLSPSAGGLIVEGKAPDGHCTC